MMTEGSAEDQQTSPGNMILGNSRCIADLRLQISRLAAFDGPGNPHVPTTLLVGETGTGKGLVARVIHQGGPRSRAPFVDVNCGAIPETMIEAELFGFEAGAFTDAKRAKPGLFEAASGGTLFLDEIDSLSLPLQSKVLKAIEEKRVRRLGAVAQREVDVKLIAASQRDLQGLVDQGTFRADLYHRLAVLILVIPPLRERGADVVQLAEHFLRSYAAAHGLVPKRLSDAARAWLSAYTWPGNVRELGHVMERLTLLSPEDEISRDTLAELAGARLPAAPLSSTAALIAEDSAEAGDIRDALRRTGGNVVRAARLLGVGRNALRYRIRRLGIPRPDDEAPRPAAPSSPAPLPARLKPAVARTPAWEQKPVAVLALAMTFPDAEPADYEPWTEATRWRRAVAEHIEGFGGVLLERNPSRMVAVFGIPRAVEQMPERAVQAALAIRRAVGHTRGPRPDVRATVHVGEVRIDTAAADPFTHLLPIGEAFALPERLLGHAGSGEVLVSTPVARRIERSCELESRQVRLGPSEADRRTAHAVLQLRPRLPAGESVDDLALTPFVGRDRETDVLMEAFARAAAGHGQVVFLAGDAGMGKSRLLAEFRRRVADQPHHWIEGRCASYGTTTPFLPLVDGLRRSLGIEDRDDDASASAKVAREVDRLGAEFAWTLPFVKQLLSLEVADESVRALDSASRRSELFRALRALMLRAAEFTTLVVAVEDLHWVDPATEEYLAFVEDAVPTVRVLLVLSHRTGYRQPFGDRSYHQRITVRPLSPSEMSAMTGYILGAGEMPEGLRGLIVQKAEGNPFFVEEITKSLLEEGALRREDGRIVLARSLDDITVPDTIHDVLMARIDRLAEESRLAIQVAAVIGREFALRLLARITEAGERIRTHVEELRSLELIYEKALHPELAYMFKHALTHDVAYESVVRDRRTTLHSTIGLTIEELYADRIAEQYETLAHHFDRADDWERAVRYHELSAEKAAKTHANRAVVEHCQRALSIAEGVGDRVSDVVRARLNQCLGRAYFYLSEYAASAAAYEEAAARTTDVEAKSLLLGAAAFSHFWAHRYDACANCLTVARDIARVHAVPSGEAMALSVLGFYSGVHDGDIDDYERRNREALAICGRHPNEAVEGFAHMQLVLSAEWTGDYEATFARAGTAIAFGRRLRAPELIIFPTWFLGKARCCTGDYGGALALLQEAYELCDRIGDRAWKSRMLNTIGWCLGEIGAVERARAYNARAAELAREIGDPEILANADINLAMNHLASGHVDAALQHLEPIEQALARPGDPWMRWRYSLHALHVRARIELARQETGRALDFASAELTGARRYRAPKIEARALTLRGTALLAVDQRAEADAAFREALGIAERLGYRRGIWQAHGALAQIAARGGHTTAAADHRASAQRAGDAAAQSLADDELRRQLVAAVGPV